MANFRKFGNTDKDNSEKRSSERSNSSSRPFKSSGDSSRSEERPKFNREQGRGRDDKPRYGSNDRGGSSRPSYNREDKPKFGGDKPRFNSDRPSRPSFNRDEKPRYNSDRPSNRDEKPRYGSDRPSNRDEKPRYGSDRSDRTSRPPFNRDENSRQGSDRSNNSRDSRSFNRDDKPRYGASDRPARPPFNRDEKPRYDADRPSRPPFNRDDKSGDRSRPFNREERNSNSERPSFNRDERPRYGNDNSDRRSSGRDERPSRGDDNRRPDERSFRNAPAGRGKTEKSGFSKEERPRKNRPEIKQFKPDLDRQVGPERAPRYDPAALRAKAPERFRSKIEDNIPDENEDIRLNKYISNSGLCSRREADELIESGMIKVNGKVVTEMGYKVKDSDTIKYGKDVLNRERMMYILLNKPKDFITTMDDPKERKTVMDLVGGACKERVYPVGRLDRNTTGLLLLTNDGELTEKLTHPTNDVKKIYQAELDKPITTEHFEAIKEGIELEDGFVKPDELALVTPDAFVVGIEIHSGKNRIVRRIFENFGYEVTKLDRTTFAGLTKKDLPRGKWRFLNEKELIRLKYML